MRRMSRRPKWIEEEGDKARTLGDEYDYDQDYDYDTLTLLMPGIGIANRFPILEGYY